MNIGEYILDNSLSEQDRLRIQANRLYGGCEFVRPFIKKGLRETIKQKRVTYDLERQMEGAKLLKCSEFGQAVIENM